MTDSPATRSDRRLGWQPLTYEMEMYSDTLTVELPFVVAVFADLSGQPEDRPPPFKERKFVSVDVDNLDAVMKGVRPRLTMRVGNRLMDDDSPLSVELKFDELDDFRPERVALQVEPLQHLLEVRTQLAPLSVRLELRPELADALESVVQDANLVATLKQHFEGGTAEDLASEDAQKLENEINDRLGGELGAGSDPLRPVWALLEVLPPGGGWRAPDLRGAVDETITRIDEQLARQLDEILHHEGFQRLEATWRALSYLVRQAESGDLLKIRVFNATKKELSKELRKFAGAAFYQSTIFRSLYEAEVYMFGGEPYGMVLCDYEVSHVPEDVKLLEGLSTIGATMSAPVMLGASPELLGMDTWQELPVPRDLAKIFDVQDYARWRDLRDRKESAYLILVLPRLLARLPWDTRDNVAAHGFSYVEDSSQPNRLLWMNGVFGLATVITNAFARDRWCADLRGPTWGRVEGLPAHYVVENNEITEVVGPTEVDISDQRHFELERLGLVSMARHRRGEYAAVLTPISLAKPPVFDEPQATERARLAIQLEQVLCVGRVSQAVLSFIRDHTGEWQNWDCAAEALQEWLTRYTVPSSSDESLDSQNGELLAPFKSVSVRLRPVDDRAGEQPVPQIEVELNLNYVPRGAPVARMIVVSPPPGVLSFRLIPLG